ncbi:tubulin-tyrosine ligase family protein, putative [Ichthyophthirius multifiliis]|uniref:Tubulin-tyrosine ligase family protein, putative n=1 Tax=Ichthyophthirius multifiliis TaxID=5932 RepID=G0QRR6_ICHMU|nr:tubulin-tyrosine ligase family protein, putative [Ichthyophthirius multifiliis]EGR32087.1 tubulin-tyrosine ligase family protein, putative [Ichthyophthirius multifiliis]|eukprot:XP_004035573.1 tubulin-tyrosine ligase family protein, putative [Ichthyophthirius multifiliis]
MESFKNIATDCVKAVYRKIEPNKKQFSFELFRLDFMIDESYNTWLIEVNTNPCLETKCPLLNRIISSLIENVFKIAVDPIFPPPNFPKINNIDETREFEYDYQNLNKK